MRVLYSGLLTLGELANRLGCRLEGDATLEVQRVEGIERAGPGDLTFFVNPRYTAALRTTRASAVILGEDAPAAPCAMLRSPHPYVTFAEAVGLFADAGRPAPGVDPRSVVADDAVIAGGVSIGPFVFVGRGVHVGTRTVIHSHVCIEAGANIGGDCVIHSFVAIRERVSIGHRVVIQNGAVLGSDGFGFARRPNGTHQKIPQVGRVVVEDDVEIGANAAVDRPAVGETRIGAGTKIDNLVQVAHGVTIGRNVLLAAQVGIAGSTVVEDEVALGGQVGVAGHLTVGRGARATAQSGIPNSVEPGALVSGYPAIPNREWLKASAVFSRLPELKKAVANLEEQLAALDARLSRPQEDRDR